MKLTSLQARIARRLVAHAAAALPINRRDWADAMRAEFDHVDQRAALQWALGCVVVSYTERVRLMDHSNLRVSKWVVSLEALVCFGPTTLLWLIALTRLKYFIHDPKVLFDIAVCTIAPFSLLIGLRLALFEKPPHRKLLISLAIAFLAIGALMIAGKYLRPGRAFLWAEVEWSMPVLFSLLPAFCCWHLSLFAKTPSEPLRAA